uniref:Uncharacterized protein n=1 Tax=Chromera velia CCMP2878 TaxID=1169474 RepID=A0A0G4HF35_9ALVE|eukprot:Cvel_6559.t1-p1 / transcript=Cvel_6559.t1 / gene=Cvel_6559 / organism=Chromera_velia_CCMP2878 / gene_product=hypothetical protein / transcript_product=hypothetical protein / location=Cvel_scaffold323:30594-32493(+) / protein_length=407 / sequence_SO=supercontig / SO=protein_coding / is_pseudo=false
MSKGNSVCGKFKRNSPGSFNLIVVAALLQALTFLPGESLKDVTAAMRRVPSPTGSRSDSNGELRLSSSSFSGPLSSAADSVSASASKSLREARRHAEVWAEIGRLKRREFVEKENQLRTWASAVVSENLRRARELSDQGWQRISPLADRARALSDQGWQRISPLADRARALSDQGWQSITPLADRARALSDQGWQRISPLADRARALSDQGWQRISPLADRARALSDQGWQRISPLADSVRAQNLTRVREAYVVTVDRLQEVAASVVDRVQDLVPDPQTGREMVAKVREAAGEGVEAVRREGDRLIQWGKEERGRINRMISRGRKEKIPNGFIRISSLSVSSAASSLVGKIDGQVNEWIETGRDAVSWGAERQSEIVASLRHAANAFREGAPQRITRPAAPGGVKDE